MNVAAQHQPTPATVAHRNAARAATNGRAAAQDSATKETVASERMTGAQAIVRSLEELGADVVFGLPGGAVLPLYDPIYSSTKMRHVLVRHEQGAGHAATGYAQVSGKVGVCIATSGPGATNLVTPIADANLDSVPIRLSIWSWLLINVGTLTVSLLMMLAPSYLITKINPARTIRFE